jgi:hypothetical protein
MEILKNTIAKSPGERFIRIHAASPLNKNVVDLL